MLIQLDLFEEKNEESELKVDLREIRQTLDNVRKGIFFRHNELSKLYMNLNQRLEKIEKNIISDEDPNLNGLKK